MRPHGASVSSAMRRYWSDPMHGNRTICAQIGQAPASRPHFDASRHCHGSASCELLLQFSRLSLTRYPRPTLVTGVKAGADFAAFAVGIWMTNGRRNDDTES